MHQVLFEAADEESRLTKRAVVQALSGEVKTYAVPERGVVEAVREQVARDYTSQEFELLDQHWSHFPPDVPPVSSTFSLHLHKYSSYVSQLTNQVENKYVRGGVIGLLVVVCALFMAASSQVSFNFPWDNNVPVTAQTLGVFLICAIMGKNLGIASVVLYLIMGCFGAPFFASQRGGLEYFVGPTGGFLVSFVFAAGVIGWLVEKGYDRRFLSSLVTFMVGNVVVYLFGVPWLAHFVGWENALMDGLVPFLVGDAVKIVISSLVVPLGWKLKAFVLNRKQNVNINWKIYFK
eukprot:CAMPEP_0174270888 /NCGR_PEP_ID=MMETSP0439-20130205/46124_1 /TAXON_ID=0 /ORGANISM="Stereomyxa ramosa, Strain Chinc5" /LENGTH=290 /DNA_ID=CAMNT_0015360537 /DNA_START=48 /DNA_END=920 /DNA_ORIENTATION=+